MADHIAEARLKAIASNESLQSSLAAVVVAVAALLVGLGLVTSTQEAVLIATTTPAVALGGLILHAIHTGSISPSPLVAAISSLAVQIGADLIAFLPNWNATVQLVIPLVSAVTLLVVQLAIGLKARTTTLQLRA